jgi:hypothetical protein
MGLLGFLKGARPHEDAELGVLERAGGYWEGTIALAGHGELPLRISGTRAGPDATSLGLARELRRRMPELRPAIQAALFEHYGPYRDAAGGEDTDHPDLEPALATPAEVWNHITPRYVSVAPLSGVPTVELAYEAEWDVEHTVAARFQSWAFLELCGSV